MKKTNLFKGFAFIPPLGVRGLLFVFFALVALAYCKKKDDPTDPNYDPNLPNATQEGKNTFGCYVNGQPWLPKSSVFSVVPLYGYFDSGYFSIIGRIATTSKRESIGMDIKDLNKIGIYNINTTSLEDGGIRFYNYSDNVTDCGEYSEAITGFYRRSRIEITKYDSKNGIISGLFEATLKIPNCDTLKITKGRFDLKVNF